jgi:hypothetical protein
VPFSFAFDYANQVFLVTFEGRVTDELILDFYRAAARLIVKMPELRGSIVDFTPISEFAVSPETIREVAWSPPVDTEASRPRVLVAPSAGALKLAWTFEKHGAETRPSLHIVKSMQHAYAVLGITNPKFEPLAPTD